MDNFDVAHAPKYRNQSLLSKQGQNHVSALSAKPVKRRGRKPGIRCSILQRNAANARERSRMRVLSTAFMELKSVLPWVPRDTKLSKLDTLKLAAGYISYLDQILSDSETPSCIIIQPESSNWTRDAKAMCTYQQNAYIPPFQPFLDPINYPVPQISDSTRKTNFSSFQTAESLSYLPMTSSNTQILPSAFTTFQLNSAESKIDSSCTVRWMPKFDGQRRGESNACK
ncbi:hypothetical protein ACTXT7_004359 [Hymenolepis weldensis]